MPKASTQTASETYELEGYEGHFEHFDGGVLGRIREVHGGRGSRAAVQGAPRRSLPVPALGVRRRGARHVHVHRRPRGDVRDGRRVLRPAGPHAPALRRLRGRRVLSDRRAREDARGGRAEHAGRRRVAGRCHPGEAVSGLPGGLMHRSRSDEHRVPRGIRGHHPASRSSIDAPDVASRSDADSTAASSGRTISNRTSPRAPVGGRCAPTPAQVFSPTWW